MKIVAIVGARPQFIKHVAFETACRERNIDLVTIHTGQHYDHNMSQVFFDELGMSKPSYQLDLGGGKHGEQTAKMMAAIENIVIDEKPAVVVVYGDTNSTLAGAIVVSKLHIPLAHIEAGLRSYNRQMPEEINRILTDVVAEVLFVPSQHAVDNLAKEGITDGVYIVGDLMKDVLHLTDRLAITQRKEVSPYYYATIHRPYNTDDIDRLTHILQTLEEMDHKVLFAIHPRTKGMMEAFDLSQNRYKNIEFIDPQPYLENIRLIKNAAALLTDSGGMQKEAYWLEVPCITVRSETEWVETLQDNANTLVFDDLSVLPQTIHQPRRWDKNLYGDGQSAKQMVDILIKRYAGSNTCN